MFKLAFGWNFTNVHLSGLNFPKIVALFGRLLIIANLAIALTFILIGFASEAFWSLNFKNIKNNSLNFEKIIRFYTYVHMDAFHKCIMFHDEIC